MKTFAECVNEYNAVKKNISAIELEQEVAQKQISELLKDYRLKPKSLRNREDNAITAKLSDFNQKTCELEEQKNAQEIVARIWKDNARQALFADTSNLIVELIGKYAGKPFGEKTAEKFCAEFKEKTNVNIYINRVKDYGQITLMPDTYMFNWDDFNVNVKGALLDGNRLIAHGAEDLSLNYCPDYVENPVARAREIVAAYSDLKAEYEQFKNQLSQFNKLLPTSIKSIDIGYMRSYLF